MIRHPPRSTLFPYPTLFRFVVIAGVDVVPPRLYRLSQNGNGGVNIARRSPHLGTSELHCPVAHAVQGHRCARQREAAGEISLLHHFVSPTAVRHLLWLVIG